MFSRVVVVLMGEWWQCYYIFKLINYQSLMLTDIWRTKFRRTERDMEDMEDTGKEHAWLT